MVRIASRKIERLFSPRSIAFIGGTIAGMAIRRCVDMGYQGKIWSVHPTHKSIAGYDCFACVEDLPHVPDAAFIGIRRDLAIDVVRSLSDSGAGGCVCYAAGFAEMGDEGQVFQDQLVEAAGNMPLIGPNTFGFVNYLDKCALWPYLFGGETVEHGVALISQSGNIAMNLTMNKRSVNFTHVIGTGNQAVLGPGELIDAILQDDRVTAIGMYIEGFGDVESFSRAALGALEKGVPIVVMKVGKTKASARQSSSHTSSLTGSDVLYDALFNRLGIIRVNSLNRLLETLKVLDLSGPLPGRNILSLSCSGGEAAIIADMAPEFGFEMRPFSDSQMADLEGQFPDYVTLSNPFDYNTSIWGDQAAQERCFTSAMQGDHDAAILIYDHPTVIAREVDEWMMALNAFIAAHKKTGKRAFVICTISELLPKELRDLLIDNGIVPLQGLEDGLSAMSSAATYHDFRNNKLMATSLPRFTSVPCNNDTAPMFLDEWQSKCQLRDFGLAVPEGGIGSVEQVVEIADRVGYPVVVKAVGANFKHKSDIGAVIVNLRNADEVTSAVTTISESVANNHGSVQQFLVERMVVGAIAELIIGIKRDEQFGLALVIGAGGILVELIADSVSLLLPTDRQSVTTAINSLTIAKLLKGFRGNPAGDMNAIVDAVLAISAYSEQNWDRLLELDVNPLMVLPQGQGVVAVDALICINPDGLDLTTHAKKCNQLI
ncbi:MAG: acetate--CoA ligase family protein [Proteobacteria bacterium]|nr:acetate--CoA ligase family protein [Pseudomonadota bacterium]